MKNKERIFIIFIICFIFQNGLCKTSGDISKETPETDMEEYLHKAEIVSVEEKVNESGRTDWWKITLNDGKHTRQAVFKWINRSRPKFLPDSYHYEIAAYELNKLLELKLIPPVVEREVKETKGSLQIFIEGCLPLILLKRKGIEPSNPKIFKLALQELTVFENLVYCERIDPGDILIHENDWKIYRVDFSEAFAPEEELLPGSEIYRCSKHLYQSLQKLDTSKIKSKLAAHLNNEEIEALLKRKKLILEKINTLIKEKGESSVLFND